MSKIIPRDIVWWDKSEWQIRPLMTEAEFRQSPAAKEYSTYKEYVKNTYYLNQFLDLPENADLLNPTPEAVK